MTLIIIFLVLTLLGMLSYFIIPARYVLASFIAASLGVVGLIISAVAQYK